MIPGVSMIVRKPHNSQQKTDSFPLKAVILFSYGKSTFAAAAPITN